MTELRTGDVFAGHEILGVAGRGGMGVVYRARQLDLDRPVALKLIAPGLAQDDDFRERFVRESRAAAAIDHPNVIPVYGAGEEDGQLWLAMRYVDGADLRTQVHREGPLPADRAALVAAQIGSALDAAHARGLVHRDVKPANVLLAGGDETHAYLTDFGLTKRLAAEASMTGSGRWVGTLGYVAPEQIRGEPADARADVYALGCVLYFALTAAAPFRRESDEATLWAHLNDAPPPLSDVAPDAPEALQAVVDRALAKAPEDRYPSAGDLGRAALAAAGTGPAPPPERVVARGAAAPGGAAEEATASAATPTTRTGDTPVTAAGARRGGARSWLGPAIALLAGAGVVVATAAVVSSGDEAGGPPATGTTTAPSAAAAATVVRTVEVDPRPNDVTLLDGRAWVTSARTGRLTGVRLSDGHRRRIPLPGGAPAASVAAGLGSLWVVQDAGDVLLRIRPGSGRVVRRYPLPAGAPVAVAVQGSSVWVGRRGVTGTGPDSVVKVDPGSGATREVVFGQEGVQDLAASRGAIYVTNRRRSRVSRISARTGERTSQPVGSQPRGLAVGAGHLWVAGAGDNTVTRLDLDLGDRARIAVGAGPIGVAAGDRTVWSANFAASTVTPIDARTSRAAPADLQSGINPFAIVADGDVAVVTNLADGTVMVLRDGSR